MSKKYYGVQILNTNVQCTFFKVENFYSKTEFFYRVDKFLKTLKIKNLNYFLFGKKLSI